MSSRISRNTKKPSKRFSASFLFFPVQLAAVFYCNLWTSLKKRSWKRVLYPVERPCPPASCEGIALFQSQRQKRPRSNSDLSESETTKKAKFANTTPEDRLKAPETHGQSFYVQEDSTGTKELRCKVCGVRVDHTRKDSIMKHIDSDKHKLRLSEKMRVAASRSALLDYGVAAEKVPIGAGGNLRDDHKKWRNRVLETFLRAVGSR